MPEVPTEMTDFTQGRRLSCHKQDQSMNCCGLDQELRLRLSLFGSFWRDAAGGWAPRGTEMPHDAYKDKFPPEQPSPGSSARTGHALDRVAGNRDPFTTRRATEAAGARRCRRSGALGWQPYPACRDSRNPRGGAAPWGGRAPRVSQPRPSAAFSHGPR